MSALRMRLRAPIARSPWLSVYRSVALLLSTAWLATCLSPSAAQQAGENKIVSALGIHWSDSPVGIVVERIDPQSPATKLGLKAGDVVISVNGREVTSGDELAATLKKLVPGDALR